MDMQDVQSAHGTMEDVKDVQDAPMQNELVSCGQKNPNSEPHGTSRHAHDCIQSRHLSEKETKSKYAEINCSDNNEEFNNGNEVNYMKKCYKCRPTRKRMQTNRYENIAKPPIYPHEPHSTPQIKTTKSNRSNLIINFLNKISQEKAIVDIKNKDRLTPNVDKATLEVSTDIAHKSAFVRVDNILQTKTLNEDCNDGKQSGKCVLYVKTDRAIALTFTSTSHKEGDKTDINRENKKDDNELNGLTHSACFTNTYGSKYPPLILCTSLQNGDLEMAVTVLSDGTYDINELDENSVSPLMLCCCNASAHPIKYFHYLYIMKLILQHKTCNVNLRNKFGVSALLFACFLVIPDFVELMISDKRCDPSQQDADGNTALIICCEQAAKNQADYHKSVRTIHILLKHARCGINMKTNMPDHKGMNALMCACGLALPEIVQLLLNDRRCDPSQQDAKGTTPLILCCEQAYYNQSKHDQFISLIQMLLMHDKCCINFCNKRGWNALMFSCYHGLQDVVELLLSDSRCDPSQHDDKGNTPLMYCCIQAGSNTAQYHNSIGIIQTLLKHEKCDVNVTNHAGENPLLFACYHALPHIVELLLSDFRCDPSKHDANGNTPLIRCCERAHSDSSKYDQMVSVIQMLLMHEKCGINICNHKGKNALSIACYHALPEIVELLVSDSRCALSQQDVEGNTPLMQYCIQAGSNPNKYYKCIQIIQTLLKHDKCDIDKTNHKGMNALMIACFHVLPEIAELLISDNRCDLSQQDFEGNSPLIHCCLRAGSSPDKCYKCNHIIQTLLKHKKCDINTANRQGKNALMIACYHALPEIAELLLSDSRCDPSQQDIEGNTPLSLCSFLAGNSPEEYYTYIHIFQTLLKHEKCEVNSSNRQGQNALMVACYHAVPEIVELLLSDNRCDPSQQDIEGNTPLSLCSFLAGNNPDKYDTYIHICQTLLKHEKCDVNTANRYGENALLIACYHALPGVVDLLLSDKMCDPNQQDTNGNTPLIFVCNRAVLDPSKFNQIMCIIRMLLVHDKCCINMCNNGGSNGLFAACDYAVPEIAELLLSDSRCDPSQQDAKGNTPLYHCCYRAFRAPMKYNEEVSIIKLLLNHDKCGINKPNTDGTNALMYASGLTMSEILQLLLRDSRCTLCAKDNYGATCLHHLCSTSNVEQLELCLDLFVQHIQFRDCIEICDAKNYSALDRLLQNRYIVHPEFGICKAGLKIISALLPYTVLIQDSNRTAALAMLFANYDICRAIIQSGKHINSSLPNKETLLHCAIQKKSLRKINLVFAAFSNHAALLNVKWRGMTPLDLAISIECNAAILNVISNRMAQYIPLTDIKSTILNSKPVNQTFEGYVSRLGIKSLFIDTCEPGKTDPLPHDMNTLVFENDIFFMTDSEIKSTIFKERARSNTLENVSLVKNCKYLQTQFGVYFKDVAHCALRIAKAISQAFKHSEEFALLEYEPVISGSMKEQTKCFYPNEVDIMCKFKHEGGLEVKHYPPASDIIVEKGKCWARLCDENKKLKPRFVLMEFLHAADTVLTTKLICDLMMEIPHIHMGQYPLCYEDKIPRLMFTYNRPPFLNLKVSVDLAPVFKCPWYQLAKPLPLKVACDEFLALLKTSRHDNSSGQIYITYTEAEHKIMFNLPEYVRDGYTTAKAMRLASICEPGLDPKTVNVVEPIDIQSYISSYILKNCLYNILIEIENGKIEKPEKCRFVWADQILAQLEENLRQRRIPAWYDNNHSLLDCEADTAEFACCQKRCLMLALTRRMRSWLDVHMERLKHTDDRSVYRSRLFIRMLDII